MGVRNQFAGAVKSLKYGSVMSEVVVDLGGGREIVSLISAASARRLQLKKGARVVAIVKPTQVLIANAPL